MKQLMMMIGISLATACGATAPPTEMPATTQTTGAPVPVPGDTQVPSDNKPIPPLNTASPTINPPAAAMQNTTTTATGEAPTPTAP